MNVCQFISHFRESDTKFLGELGEKIILFFSFLGDLILLLLFNRGIFFVCF